jgi:hypothetical protein
MSVVLDVKLGGKTRMLIFNNWQREALGKIFGHDPLKAGQAIAKKSKESPLDALCDLIYTGLVGAYRVQRKDLDFTEADIVEWVGEIENQVVSEIFSAWVDSTGLRRLIPVKKDDEPESEKDKRAKKKGSPGRA